MKNLIKHEPISIERADELTLNFIEALNVEVPKIATWAWFDIDELNEYLDEAKYLCKANNKTFSGIRIYIGKYSPAENKGFFTVYLAPTETADLNGMKSPKDPDIKMKALNLGGTGIERI
ncbi:MAG: hypothetical protein IPH57_13125 [Saprospiraceae bacterium]|nr:hypothetical protein [Saprospiraceae bacterium]